MLVEEEKHQTQFIDLPGYDAELKIDCCLTTVQLRLDKNGSEVYMWLSPWYGGNCDPLRIG